jgi:serine/threonine protein kinase
VSVLNAGSVINALLEPAALVGAVLNQQWRLVGLRGEGGIGLVYEAEGLHGEGVKAVKILRPEFCEDPQIVQRFLDEAAANARIQHECIARVHEARRAEDGSPYLVMELLRGMPLATAMNRGRMAAQQAVATVRGLLSGLGAAHQAGVVHRDLKPDNVFVTLNEQGLADVKILDFGVARVMDAAGGMARKTRTGMLLGTPGYMSPEQIKNVKTADRRADLWSAGVIFYEMLTGALAFEADNDFTRITKVLTASATPIDQVAPHYAHWAPFFAKALAPDPDSRFQSAAEMDAAIEAVAHGGTLPVAAPTPVAVAAADAASVVPAGPFGRTDTAVSAAVSPSAAMSGRDAGPLVQVLPSPKRGVPAGMVAVIAVVSLLVGLALGYLIGVG